MMKEIKEYFKSLKYHPPLRRTAMWRIIEFLESTTLLIFNVTMSLLPAIVVGRFTDSSLTYVLLFGGILRIIYMGFKRQSIKEIWLLIRWHNKGK